MDELGRSNSCGERMPQVEYTPVRLRPAAISNWPAELWAQQTFPPRLVSSRRSHEVGSRTQHLQP